MQQLEHIHGGNITRASGKYGIPKDKIIDFSANINPLGPADDIIAALTNNLNTIVNYPDPDCTELRTVLAGYLGIDPELLLMGNGAAELIYQLVRVTGRKKALLPVPTFSEYALSVLSQGGEVIEVELEEEKGFSLPAEEIIRLIPEVDLLFICSPNNPTGCLVDKKTIEHILEAASSYDVMVLIDEAFMDFVPQRSLYTMMPSAGRISNLAVLYSLTKFFGIPGLRLGALAAGDHRSHPVPSQDPEYHPDSDPASRRTPVRGLPAAHAQRLDRDRQAQIRRGYGQADQGYHRAAADARGHPGPGQISQREDQEDQVLRL